MSKKLVVDVWSDVACPWCYVGKRRLEAALARFAHADSVAVVWRSFELDPASPRTFDDGSYVERLARKYRTTPAQAKAMIDRMVGVAAADGLAFDFARIRAGNTFDAHRLLHAAKARGVQGALKERLFRGYFSQGEPIGEHAALARMAVDAGLDADDAASVLATDAYADEARADEREAGALGIEGVPFFVFGKRLAVSGAQPAEVLLRALGKAWDATPEVLDDVREGAVCGPEGCA